MGGKGRQKGGKRAAMGDIRKVMGWATKGDGDRRKMAMGER
jgi:hypothetical protein